MERSSGGSKEKVKEVEDVRRALRKRGTTMRLGSALNLEEDGMERTASLKSPKSQTPRARRLQTRLGSQMFEEETPTSSRSARSFGEEPEAESGLSRLRMLTSAVTSFAKPKVEEVAPETGPSEVILSSDEESSDDEEEEVERDFLSALQRVRDSGRLSFSELRVFKEELSELGDFQDEQDSAILAAFARAKYVEATSDELLWSRYSELYSGSLPVQQPICLLVGGRLSVAKPGMPEGCRVTKGGVVSCADPEVLGIVALEPSRLLYVGYAEAMEDMYQAKQAWRKADQALRKRPPSVWSKDQLVLLLRSLEFLPFFEDLDEKTLLSLVRNLKLRRVAKAQSLPPKDLDLVVFWEGKAGKYKQVRSASDELLRSQRERQALEALESHTRRREEGDRWDEAPELEEELVKDQTIYLKRRGDLRLGAVLGQRKLVDPLGPDTWEPIIRCEDHCEVLCLSRPDYLQCLKDSKRCWNLLRSRFGL